MRIGDVCVFGICAYPPYPYYPWPCLGSDFNWATDQTDDTDFPRVPVDQLVSCVKHLYKKMDRRAHRSGNGKGAEPLQGVPAQPPGRWRKRRKSQAEIYDQKEATLMNADPILHQIGYPREDTLFLSLNLTPNQAKTLDDALALCGATGEVEEGLTAILEEWLNGRLSNDNQYDSNTRSRHLLRRAV